MAAINSREEKNSREILRRFAPQDDSEKRTAWAEGGAYGQECLCHLKRERDSSLEKRVMGERTSLRFRLC
jgi:hypothetical protein